MPDSPLYRELAQAKGGRDITRPLLIAGFPLPNDDPILQRFGAGDLLLAEDMLRHPAVWSAFQQRRTAVVSKEWRVDPASDAPADVAAATDLEEQMKRLGHVPLEPRATVEDFDRVTDEMLFGVYYGYAVAECLYRPNGARVELAELRVRKQKRFVFDQDGHLLLRTLELPNGEQQPDRKFWTFVHGAEFGDAPYGKGLYVPLYWPVYLSSNGKAGWLRFLEKCGIPTVLFVSNETDETKRDAQTQKVADGVQNEGTVAFPPGTDLATMITLLEATRATGDFQSLVDLCRKEIVQIILSQTMTSDTAVRGSTEIATVHQGVADDVVKSDADRLCASFMAGPARWLTEWNHPGAQTPIVYRQLEAEPDLDAIAARLTALSALGYEPTEDFIRETFGEGFVKRPPSPTPAPQLGPDGQPLLGLVPGGANGAGDGTDGGAAFAEPDPARVRNRVMQQGMVEAADLLGQQAAHYAERVAREALDYVARTGNVGAAKEYVAAKLAEMPHAGVVETTERGRLAARLLGRLRGQR